MAHKTKGVRLAFPLVEYEGVEWAMVDHDWQPHKPGQELGPDEYLYTLRLVRCGENDIMEEKFVQDITKESVEEILASELTIFAQEV